MTELEGALTPAPSATSRLQYRTFSAGEGRQEPSSPTEPAQGTGWLARGRGQRVVEQLRADWPQSAAVVASSFAPLAKTAQLQKARVGLVCKYAVNRLRFESMKHYEAIVLGVGGVGSAAIYHLAQRGVRTLGIERFDLAHDRGSSHGQTRLIRQTYFEHPDYVPLVQRAFAGWRDLEQAVGERLYHEVGLVQIGLPDGEVIRGVRKSARMHNLSIENLSAHDTQRRFPGLYVPEHYEAVYETRAGYLLVERCVLAHANEAVRLGAELHTGETVRCWRADGAGVVVETDRDTYATDNLIVTAGPWAAELLADLGVPLEVRRKPLYWFRPHSDTYRAERGFPGYLYDLPEGCFYGFPQIDDAGIKVAEHSGGRIVPDPLAVDRDVDVQDQARVASFVERYLVQASTECLAHAVCMYTMSPDGHFLVDRHPQFPQVAVAAGLSGHGFKFAGVLGEELARLACEGTVDAKAKFLGLGRESLRPVC